MGNCLVTKLKGTVDNPNLPKLGYIKIHVVVQNEQDAICPIWIISQGDLVCNLIGNGYFYKGTYADRTGQTTTISGVTTTAGYRMSEGEYDIEIYSKYEITRILLGEAGKPHSFSFDLDELQYAPLTDFEIRGLIAGMIGITGHLAKVPDLENISFYLAGADLEGTMTEWAKLKLPSGLSNAMFYASYLFPTHKCSGRIEDLVEQVNSFNLDGRLSDGYRISSDYMRSEITFNGGHLDRTLRAYPTTEGGTIVREVDSTLLATYTRSTNTWVYENV